jgi:hypothetical protein
VPALFDGVVSLELINGSRICTAGATEAPLGIVDDAGKIVREPHDVA